LIFPLDLEWNLNFCTRMHSAFGVPNEMCAPFCMEVVYF